MRYQQAPQSPHAEESRLRSVAYSQLNSAEDEQSSSNSDSDHRAKSYTIEEAVEKLGFGRFQMKLLIISGIMGAADAMEMLLLAVLGPALRCEWQLTSSQVATLTTVVFLGMLVGAPAWGAVSDKQGRWSVFALSLSLMAYFGLICSFSPSYFWLICLRGLVGFNVGGAASCFTLQSEYLPRKHRAKTLIVCNLFWAAGSTFEVVLAALVLPTLGWRYLTAFSAMPLILSIPALMYLPESARYLLASGRTDQAAAAIDQIARENGKPPMKGRPAEVSIHEAERGHLRALFHMSYRRTTLVLFCLWFGIAFSYYGIVLVSTEILHFHKNCFATKSVTVGHNATEMVTDTTCCKSLKSGDYKVMLISSLGEFVIIPFLLLTIDSLGRRWTMAINYLLMGLFFSVIYLCIPKTATSVLLLLARAHAGGVFKIIYIYTTEVYPTVIRSVGLGLCSSMARFGSMTAPFIAQVVLPDVSLGGGFAIFGAVSVSCAVLALLLPIETNGRALPHGVVNSSNTNNFVHTADAGGVQVPVQIRVLGKVKT